MSVGGCKVSAAFLGEPGARFLAVNYQCGAVPRAHIIHLPAFGEEMNRCRALVATQARQFAEAGYSCTVVDLYGTGDSEGEPSQASFEIWRGNVASAIAAGKASADVPVILWGLRLGGLLALDFAAHSEQPIQQILLWQPVLSGKRYVTQLLRQRVASLVGKDLPPETTQEIRQRLDQGEAVEVSGYILGGQLLGDIEQASSLAATRLCEGSIHWFEHTEEPGEAASAGTVKQIAQLQEDGNSVSLQQFSDPPLWQLHKRDAAPMLLALTGQLAL